MSTSPCANRAHSPRVTATGVWSCPDCAAGVEASPLQAAFAARDTAMAATTIARPDDAAKVAAAIRRLAATGRPFSANDARQIHGVKGGVVGATFNALKAEGLIRPVGDEVSTDKGTHGHRIFRWIGTQAARSAA